MATEYGKLNYHQRAQLKQSDNARYLKIRAEHEHTENALRARIANAKTYADKACHRLELVEFLAGDVTSGVTAKDVAEKRTIASEALANAEATHREEAEEAGSRGGFRVRG